MSICSQFTSPLGLCKARHTHAHTHTHPWHPVEKQVLARLIPVCELKAMHYLSDCLVLYVRQAAAICALEALGLRVSQADRLTCTCRAGTGSEVRRVCSAPSHLPCLLARRALGLCTEGHPVQGPCVCQNWGRGAGGPSGQDRVPIWSGLGRKHILSPGYRSSQVREGIELRNRNLRDVTYIKQQRVHSEFCAGRGAARPAERT